MKIALRLILAIFVAGCLGYLVLQGCSQPWTGFGEYKKPAENIVPAKTLWDWLQLLIVPVFLAAGAWLLDGSRKRSERRSEADRQRQKTLEDYYACVTDLLLRGQLKGPGAQNEARSIAEVSAIKIDR